jgi:hypothetical protein
MPWGAERARAGDLGRAALLLWAWRTTFALVLALPAFAAAARLSAQPRGDELLFEPGGLWLADLVRSSARGAAAFAPAALLLALLAAYGGLVVLAAAMHAIGGAGRDDRAALARLGFRALPAFTFLFGAALLASAVGACGVLVLDALVSADLHRRLGEQAGDVVHVGFLAAAALAVALVGVIHDVARAAAVAEDLRGPAALRRALGVVATRRVAVVAAWAARAVCMALVVAIAWRAAMVLGVATPARAWAVAIVDQVALFLLAALRASWLGAALRHVREGDEPAPQLDIALR